MAQILTPPMLAAAVVLCAAGALKLRSPEVATRAFATRGLSAGRVPVRAFALAELALGAWYLVDPAPVAAGAVACLYACFALAALVLARRDSSCGCFGVHDASATLVQPLLSAVLALVALGAALSSAHGLGWVLARPASDTIPLLIGIAGAAYGTVLAYTLLPRAWGAWSLR